MSYLGLPRLHFCGGFQAAPSTVNNDPTHFDNAAFKPEFQERQTRGALNGWWNPDGDAAWRLIDCKVTQAWLDHDRPAAPDDPVRACLVADSDRTPPAKIVDLDPEQQLVSEIWGLQVRVSRADGTNLMRARFETAPFTDIWTRAAEGAGDITAGAMYQSVLTPIDAEIEWGDVSDSPFLTALQVAARGGFLSIKFNVDGYNMTYGSPDFTRGRIAGAIAPAAEGEPRHFVLGRHLMAKPAPTRGFFQPAGKVNFSVAVLDDVAGKIMLDLGNALPTTTAGGPIRDIGTLTLGVRAPGRHGLVSLGALEAAEYTAPGWYKETTGAVALPTGRRLTAEELKLAQENPLVLTTSPAGGQTEVAVEEAASGGHVRADMFVFRLDPGETAKARLFATRWGRPLKDARIACRQDSSQLQSQAAGPGWPGVATPKKVVGFPEGVVADRNGVAELTIVAGDPGNPRIYIDGQVYGVRPTLEEDFDRPDLVQNDSDFISFLIWNSFDAETPPTWNGCIRPILQQYANLYPIMRPIVDLGDYESVCANVDILKLTFGLPLEDPNSMPVTRDLSKAKRAAILRWLSNPGADGKPLKGEAREPEPVAMSAAPERVEPTNHPVEPMRGGKAAAANRRVAVRQS